MIKNIIKDKIIETTTMSHYIFILNYEPFYYIMYYFLPHIHTLVNLLVSSVSRFSLHQYPIFLSYNFFPHNVKYL